MTYTHVGVYSYTDYFAPSSRSTTATSLRTSSRSLSASLPAAAPPRLSHTPPARHSLQQGAYPVLETDDTAIASWIQSFVQDTLRVLNASMNIIFEPHPSSSRNMFTSESAQNEKAKHGALVTEQLQQALLRLHQTAVKPGWSEAQEAKRVGSQKLKEVLNKANAPKNYAKQPSEPCIGGFNEDM